MLCVSTGGKVEGLAGDVNFIKKRSSFINPTAVWSLFKVGCEGKGKLSKFQQKTHKSLTRIIVTKVMPATVMLNSAPWSLANS